MVMPHRPADRFRPPRLAAALLTISCLVPADAAQLASVFQDHAVLQRDQPVPVWGTGVPGEEVRVSFGGSTVAATTDAGGQWRVTLPPQQVTNKGASLTVAGYTTVEVRDLLVGEVWLCSGQSNMEWNVSRAADAAHEIAAADFPAIRFLKVGVAAVMPPAGALAGGHWKSCSPATVGGFTAVGYHFARELHGALGVPIGIIDATWGGTSIEAWLDEETLVANPALAGVFERWSRQVATYPQRRQAAREKLAAWQAAARDAETNHVTLAAARPPDFFSLEDRERPMGLFGGMIAPLIPYGLRGVAWYQGENNAKNPADYAGLLGALITGWRRQWGGVSLPFLVVQLPNYASGNPAGDSWARLRQAQARVARTVPNTALAVTIDVGDPQTVHPLDKRPVGHRLALLARARVYGEAVEAEGPTFSSAAVDGAGLRVRFTHATGLQGLGAKIPGFEIAGADRRFVPGEVRLQGDDSVWIGSAAVPAPVAVRYAWCNAPETGLVNAAGLPAAPFNSDEPLEPGAMRAEPVR